MAEVPNAPVKRLLIEGSHGCRISASALDLAAGQLSSLVQRLGDAAGRLAIVAGRKTIMDEDITKAWAELTR